MTIETIMQIIFNTAALQSPPVAKYAPIGPGKVQGAVTVTLPTKPKLVAIQAIVPVTNGDKINGIIKVGFKTIGAPNIIGSLILNIPGTKAALPNCLP